MISIVMTARNASRFIEATFESVLAQTFTDWEFIAVDHNSDDDGVTWGIIQRYAEQDARVRPFQYAQGTLWEAVNFGIEQAQHEWIARIDADDVMYPTRLEKQWAAVQTDPEVILWGTFGAQINVRGERIGSVEVGPTSRAAFDRMIAEDELIILLNPATLFRKSAWEQAGRFDPQYVAGGDIEMWQRMAKVGPIVVLTEELTGYRIHGGSVSAKKMRYQALVFRYLQERVVVEREGGTLSFAQYQQQVAQRPVWTRLMDHSKSLSRVYYRTAGNHLSEERRVRALLALILAAVLDPVFTLRRVQGRLKRRRQSDLPTG